MVAEPDGSRWPPRGIDVSTAHSARIYDWFLGGKDNFAVDRAVGETVLEANPWLRSAVIQYRAFLGRAVTFLARDAGIRQFLDIGTGIPAANNTHEVAQRVDPSARVVYVDNDPIVLAHARALLVGDPAGRTAYIEADLRDPDAILSALQVSDALDLGKPVALMLVGVLHFIRDEEDPYGIVRKLLSALPDGSYLVISNVTADFNPEGAAVGRATYHAAGVPVEMRTRAEFGRFVEGLELVDPGITVISDWRSELPPELRVPPSQVAMYAAVARISR